MNGYFGRYLKVDLGTVKLRDLEVPAAWQTTHLGGYGVALRLLLEELKPGIDPWGEENLLIFAGGAFQGSGFPGAGRHVVLAKSPKTNSVSDSYSGGYFAHELGRSGYDGILIRGKSEKPVYLLVADDEVQLCDAWALWGKEVRETEDWLKTRHGKVKVASIGPAGENQVKFASVMHDYSRAAGRPGFGAVMGDKKLKAIAIRGEQEKPFANPERLRSLSRDFARWLMEDPATRSLGEYGSVGAVEALSELGILPTRNFAQGTFAGAKAIGGYRLAETFLTGRETCTACPVRCKRVVKTSYMGQPVREVYGGLEYESAAALGSLCLVDNLEALSLANQKCNAYGLDTISTGVTIAFAMEASEKGIIDEEILWGDAEALLRLIDEVAYKKGLGKELAQGIDTLAREWDVDFDVQIKGQEVPMHEPRGKVGLAISYATSPRGGTHLEAFHDTMVDGLKYPIEELGIHEAKDRFDWERTPELCKTFEDLMSFTNSLVMCANISWSKSAGNFYPFKRIREALAAIMGHELSASEMLEIGERNYVLRKVLAVREGYTRVDDDIPVRLKEPLPQGNSAGRPIEDRELQRRIDEYYALRGFDEVGPTPERLHKLRLEEIVPYLPERGGK